MFNKNCNSKSLLPISNKIEELKLSNNVFFLLLLLNTGLLCCVKFLYKFDIILISNMNVFITFLLFFINFFVWACFVYYGFLYTNYTVKSFHIKLILITTILTWLLIFTLL